MQQQQRGSSSSTACSAVTKAAQVHHPTLPSANFFFPAAIVCYQVCYCHHFFPAATVCYCHHFFLAATVCYCPTIFYGFLAATVCVQLCATAAAAQQLACPPSPPPPPLCCLAGAGQPIFCWLLGRFTNSIGVDSQLDQVCPGAHQVQLVLLVLIRSSQSYWCSSGPVSLIGAHQVQLV